MLIDAAMLLKEQYDFVFYVNPRGVLIEDNGVRTTDLAYRLKIDSTIRELFKEYPPHRLIEIEGSTEERIKTVLETINKYL